MAYNFTTVEQKWQEYWDAHKSFRAFEPAEAADMPKAFVLDMFPYPSGSGLHVGHPEGYTATDIYSRYLRMKGYNVLHPMGWDAFGLPAEQYAIKTNTHPRLTTAANIDTFRRQIKSLGLSYDWDREVDTTNPGYVKWTQWIFLQLYNSYFDPLTSSARPIDHLVNELQNGNISVAPDGSIHVNPQQEGLEAFAGPMTSVLRTFAELSEDEQRDLVNNQRLAYVAEAPVNWCEAMGTVVANEEIVDGKTEVGNFPVERRNLRQWMLRITAYSDRLLDDLEELDWPDSIKQMQRNWIGKSSGAEVSFEVEGSDELSIEVFTTRPDTLFGATYLVLAPEYEDIDAIVTPEQRAAVATYQQQAKSKSDRDRMVDAKEKTGVFTGAYATNPLNGKRIPIWIADYVLTGYGTGAIMAVPAHDDRDFAFAKKFDLPIVQVVSSDSGTSDSGTGLRPVSHLNEAFTDPGTAINSSFLDGLETLAAKERMIDHLESEGIGSRRTTYKLRDWLFSRQRYWGEPFPLVLDAMGNHYPLDESELPVELPEMLDFKPTGTPQGPLTKATDWLRYTPPAEAMMPTLLRETNVMPQWAGSCWYFLRYIDPNNTERFVDPAKEAYWMPVDLYVGGVEHAVLHLLYARFWHKVLFDLGHVSTREPFKRLVNQGLILGETEFHFFETASGPISASELSNIGEEATDKGAKLFGYHKQTGQRIQGTRVEEMLVEKKGERWVLRANPQINVDARSFKMSKSRGNVVNPDDIVSNYGADAFRLYEMYMGPLEAQKPWSTRDIVGMSRFLAAVHRNILGDAENNVLVTIVDQPIPADLDRQLHRATKKIGEDITGLRFNTAIAELIKLNNAVTGMKEVPREFANTFALLLAPFAPHLAEELWHALGHNFSLSRMQWPMFDEAKLVETSLELPVQVNGKLRDKITVPADATEAEIFTAALASEKVKPWLEGKTEKKRLYFPGRLVNFVVA